jgi:CelD/BcsL family acetyltransferase involved in cellulose biosynthesis
VRLEIRTGDPARATLESAGFRERWEDLYAKCPWASVFQSFGYASTWYDVYRSFTPLLVEGVDADGGLRALLPIAVAPHGDLVAAGGRQSEYQVWLAHPGDGDAFIAAALECLAARYPGRTLTLRYLPPNAPREWLTSGRGIARWCALRSVRRGIMEVTETAAEAGLRKRGNRVKLKRLERVGPVVYEQLTDPAAIDALLDEIVPFCDLRHGALHDVLPFRGDPMKLPFHRALARVAGQLYVTVLRVGERVATAEFNARNRGQLVRGFAALSPALARHSPGTIHTLFLARDLARQGDWSIDLTPGDAHYKDLLATRFDEVYVLRAFLGPGRRAGWGVAEGARRAAKRVATWTGVDTRALYARLEFLRERIESTGPGSPPVRGFRALKEHLWADREVQLFELDQRAWVGRPLDSRTRADCFADLVSYRPGFISFEPRRTFLRRALGRIERGAHVYTLMDGAELVSSAWVSTSGRALDFEEVAAVVPSGTALLYDIEATPALRTPDTWGSVLPQLAQHAAALPGVERVFMVVPRGRDDLVSAARSLGATLVGSVHERIRGGRRQSWCTAPIEA